MVKALLLNYFLNYTLVFKALQFFGDKIGKLEGLNNEAE